MNPLPGSPRWHALALASALASIALFAHAQQDAPSSSEVSAAEKAVFVDPEITALKPPLELNYRYVRSSAGGEFEPGFDDTVRLALSPTSDQRCCAVRGEFLTGARALRLPEIDDAGVNPAGLFFLERAVRELQRQTGGQAAHFRRRIRLALAEEAKLEGGSAEWNGARVATRVVSISPFVNDSQRNRFPKYAAMQYVFVVSKDVPGGVLELRSRLPAADASGAASFEEVMTLVPPKR
jgi:hypothetical protein